jgi:hypothetical protein
LGGDSKEAGELALEIEEALYDHFGSANEAYTAQVLNRKILQKK